MELKPGYKQTEVGVIPEDWDVKRLGEVARFRTGPFGSALHKEDYIDNGIPIVNPMHIVDAAIVPIHEMTITAQRATELADFRLRQGDIIIGRRGEMGRCAVVAADQDGWLCGTGSMIVRANQGYSAEFLQLVLSSKPVIASIENASVGSTMINLNQGVLNDLKVALPSNTEEQQAIATSIKAVGSKVEALQALITKKRQLKQAAMQELLTGKRRLPGFEGEWEVKRLGETGKCLRGVSYKGDVDLMPYDTANTIRLLRSNNVHDSFVNTTDLRHVNSRRVATHQILTRDDIVICMANGSKALVGKAGRFQVNDGYEYTFGAFMGCFRTNPEKADPGFIFYLLQSDRYQRLIGDLLAGSSINNLKPSSVESLDFRFPGNSEQQAISLILSDIDSELTYLHGRRDSIQEVKQGMMQQLLTGKIRLR